MNALLQNRRFIIVGGPSCGGKDKVGAYLSRKYGLFHTSTSNVLRAAARAQGATDPIPRELLSITGDRLTADYGHGALCKRAIEGYEPVVNEHPGGIVITGLRRITEIEWALQNGAEVWYVDADQEQRYQWDVARNRGDTVSREAFIERDNIELHGLTKEGQAGVYILGVKALASVVFVNNADLPALYSQVERAWQR